MSTIIYHKHHIVPRHMGGTDEDSNIVKLTIAEHAGAHRILYDQYGKKEDYIAWKNLLGQGKDPEVWAEKSRLGGLKSSTKGIKHTEEHKRKVSASKTGVPRPYMQGELHPKAKAVIGDGIRYKTINEAAAANGVTRLTVRNRINNKNFDWYFCD